MKQKDLAAALGISEAMVSKLARRGMPTDSVERAARWRRRHLEPARMKGMRVDTPTTLRAIPRATTPPPAVQAPAADQVAAERAESRRLRLQLVARLGELAEVDFQRHEADLRSAIRAVHPGLRSGIELPQSVFDALTADVHAVIRPDGAAPAADRAAASPMSDADAELMGQFWAAVAGGEIVREGDWIKPVTDYARGLLACVAAEMQAESEQAKR